MNLRDKLEPPHDDEEEQHAGPRHGSLHRIVDRVSGREKIVGPVVRLEIWEAVDGAHRVEDDETVDDDDDPIEQIAHLVWRPWGRSDIG